VLLPDDFGAATGCVYAAARGFVLLPTTLVLLDTTLAVLHKFLVHMQTISAAAVAYECC